MGGAVWRVMRVAVLGAGDMGMYIACTDDQCLPSLFISPLWTLPPPPLVEAEFDVRGRVEDKLGDPQTPPSYLPPEAGRE